MIGKTISHYRILEKLGEGGMGVVYRAEDTKLKRTIALKFLSSQTLGSGEEKARFIHEAQAAAALNHPNICTVYEIDEAEGQSFIAMECVEGESLKERIRSGPLKLEDAVGIAIQVAEGLHEAHEKGIIHRDVKPANIMLTPKDQAKIMDFGLAKSHGRTQLTRTRSTLGTVAYMSPEQTRGDEVDQRTDIWSIGVMLYEMLTGQLPFKGDYEQAVVHSILNETPDPVSGLRSGLPLEIERVINKSLAKEPAERYQHADEMIADLRHQKRLLESTRTPSVTRPMSVPPRSKPRLRTLLALALIVMAVVLVFILEPFKIELGPQKEASAQENSLAIMYFENMADPDDTDRMAQMITALLITDLSESEYMYVISRQRLYDILRLLGKEDLKTIDRTVASEIAQRAGVKWILTGSILQDKSTVVLTSGISECETGKVLATQRIVGDEDEGLFDLVDRLSASIKEDLFLPEAARSETDRPVAEITTHSPEAYRYYLEGVDYAWKLYDLEAERSFRKALEQDSTFAMAYCALANILADRRGGMDPRERRSLASMAMKYADNASHRERYHIRASHAFASGQYRKAIDILREASELYPDDKEIFVWLSIYYRRVGEDAQAVEELTRAITIDPMYKFAYNLLAYDYHDLGDFDRSIWAMNKYISLAPDEANPYDTRGDLYAFNGRLPDAMASYREALRIKPGFAISRVKLGHIHLFRREYEVAEEQYRMLRESNDLTDRARGRFCLALIPAYQGRLEEALRISDDGLLEDRADDYEGFYVSTKHMLKAEIFLARGEHEGAIGEARAAYDYSRRVDPADIREAHPSIVGVLAEGGRLEEAESLAETLKEDLESGGRRELLYRYWIAAGLIDMARDDAPAAVLDLERASQSGPAHDFPIRVKLGEAYLKSGKISDAVAELEGALSRFDGPRARAPISSVKAHYLLGRAYQESGWRDKAVEQYEEFLEIWKHADPGIPEVEDARERLTTLGGGI